MAEAAELRALYRDLLADVLGEHEVLALVDDPDVPGGVVGQAHLGLGLPDAWQTAELPRLDEDWVEGLQQLVATTDLPAVFIAPQWLSAKSFAPTRERRLRGLSLPEVALVAAAQVLGPERALAVLGPASGLLSPRAARLRADLVPDLRPRLVFEHADLGPALWGTHPSFATATLVASRADAGPVRFFTWPRRGNLDPTEVRGDLQRLLHQEGGQTANGFVHRGVLDPELGLLSDPYAPETQARLADVATLGGTRPLREVFEITHGLHPAADRHLLVDAVQATEGAWVIGGGEITRKGLAHENARWRATLPAERLLRPGDLLLRRISGPADAPVPAAEVSETHPPMVAGPNVLMLRPRPDVDALDRQVARLYMTSSVAAELLRSRIGSAIHVDVRALGELPVPVPDVDLSTALAGLSDAREQLRTWEREIDDHLGGLFQHASVRESRTRTLSAGRRTRERVAAARRVDDLAFRIRALFPHPIAYRWRAVEAAGPDREGYRATLEAAEVTLCYLATMGLVQARALGYEVGYLRTVRERLAGGRSGTNLGDWIAICREVRGARALRRVAERAPLPELLELFSQDEEAEAAVNRLAQRRHDESHGRGVEDHRIAEEATQAEADLRALLGAIEFLADYPLRYVELTRRDTLRGQLSYAYRDLVGDHALVPLAQGETESPEIEAGSLYLVGRDGSLHLVRPLLLRRQCPLCGSWATFHVDRFDKEESAVVMKALEHGHTVTQPDLTEPLRLVGVLGDEDGRRTGG